MTDDDDWIWTGDQCIPPWDNRNPLPIHERLTATIANWSSIRKKPRQKLPDGQVYSRDAVDEHGLSFRTFMRIMADAGMAPIRKLDGYKVWAKKDVEDAIAMRLKAPPHVGRPKKPITAQQGAKLCSLTEEQMIHRIRFAQLTPEPADGDEPQYRVQDLRYAASHETYRGQMRV